MTASGFEIVSGSPAETLAVGRVLANWLQGGDVLLLHGDLGAGKTTLVKGIAAALEIRSVVSSPSFSLVNEYDTGTAAPVSRLNHLDLYRLQGEDDLASIGFDDFMVPETGATVIEWPERAANALPDRFLLIEIEPASQSGRRLRFVPVPGDGSWDNRIASLRSRLAAATL